MRLRTITLILAACVALVLLSGCSGVPNVFGQEESPRPSVTINQAPVWIDAKGSSGDPSADTSSWSEGTEGQREQSADATGGEVSPDLPPLSGS